MNRSKRSMSSRSRTKNWTDGKEFDFKSPSPNRKINRETNARLKKASKNVSPPKATDRRKSLYLKRLENDFVSVNVILSPRRTRRQSLASLPKTVSKTSKTLIPRAKSERTISAKSTSKSNASLPPKPTKELKQELRNVSRPANQSKSSPKDKKSPARKASSTGTKEAKKEIKSPIRKDFYSKSPPKTRKTAGSPKAVIKLDKIKLSPYMSTSKSQKISSVRKETRQTSIRRQSMAKIDKVIMSPIRQEHKPASHESFKKISLPKVKVQETKTKPRTPKAQTPCLKKPVKRLSTSTPSPRLASSKRLTRSAAKKNDKKVQIRAESPTVKGDFRKTPKVHVADIKNERESSNSIRRKLKPYTPKPEEPLKILKQALKKNVAQEMRNVESSDVSKFLRPSILSVRTPTKSSPFIERKSSLKKSPVSFSLNGTTPTKNGIHHEGSFFTPYNVPDTPLSSRKSTLSFRRYRGSVRLHNDEDAAAEDYHKKNASLDKLVSSTPMRSKSTHHVSFRDAEEDLMDISELSSSFEESKNTSSYNNRSLGFTTHSIQELKETSVQKSSVIEKPTKKSYCILM